MKLLRAYRREDGQTVVLSVLFLSVLMGMAALVLDVGSWYRADRAAQAAADASALAAAQALPYEPATAEKWAEDYAGKNGGGLKTVEVVSTGGVADDTVTVEIERQAEGFFAKLIGLDEVTVGAKASARAAGIGAARWVAPIVVDEQHEKLLCGVSCFNSGHPVTLSYLHLKNSDDDDEEDGDTSDASGSFGFINLDQSATNGVGTSTLGEWIENGYDQLMEPGIYNTSTGNPFSSTHVADSLDARIGTDLLFPIYRKITGSGTNAKYEIVGWVGFHLTGTKLTGNDEKLMGYFTDVIWDAIQSETTPPTDYGVRAVALVE